MARYDSGVLYDDGTIYDANLGVLTADEDAVAGQTPALPDRRVPWRVACAEIWGWDPLTWLPTDQLDHVSDNATRSITLTDPGRQTETLTFDVLAPLTLSLVEGDWLAVRWSVANPTNSTTYLGGVYRLTETPSADRDASGTLYHVQAVDWFSYSALRGRSSSGWYPSTTLQQFVTAYVTASQPVIGTSDTLATWLAAFLWNDSARGAETVEGVPMVAPWHVIPWTAFGPGSAAIPVGTDPGYNQITTPGTTARTGDIVTWFWPQVGGFTLSYAADGGLLLSGVAPQESGLYLTDDTTVLGTVPVPWETAQRTLQQAQYTRVEYYLNETTGLLLDFGFAQWAGADHDIDFENTERIVDEGNPTTRSGFPSLTAYCNWRLSSYTGAADTLTLTLDSAFPPCPLGRLVAVTLLAPSGSDHGVAGWYRVVGWTQPLGVGQASVALQWWSAL